MSTSVYTNHEKLVANRSYGGKDIGTVVTMHVTKDEWKELKDEYGYDEAGEFQVATVSMIVDQWVKQGATVKWLTAKDWNDQAKELENHRFVDEIPALRDTAKVMRDKAYSATKSTLKDV
jgi:hypothetical protein